MKYLFCHFSDEITKFQNTIEQLFNQITVLKEQLEGKNEEIQKLQDIIEESNKNSFLFIKRLIINFLLIESIDNENDVLEKKIKKNSISDSFYQVYYFDVKDS